MKLQKEKFIAHVDGKETGLFALKNDHGVSVAITNYGGKIVSVLLPSAKSGAVDIVAGYDDIREYIQGNKYFGAIIGRYANRIGNGELIIGNDRFQLVKNSGDHHLHGGNKSFSDVVWDAEMRNSRLVLSYLSKDGEEGYPGRLSVTCSFELNNENELHIYFEAVTDKVTVVNLTHHSFFNLNGFADHSILDHRLMINADQFLPLSENFVPTGDWVAVDGTPFDFREGAKIGERIGADDTQLKIGKGYDHCYVTGDNGKMKHAATLSSDHGERRMEIFSTAPGLQLYTGNWLDGSDKGKAVAYGQRSMVCLEPQHFPDSPHHSNFPSTVLMPGEKYTHHIIYKFYFQ